MKLTVNDIAEMSGVSKTTVSRVINKPYLVRTDTRQKVQSVMEQYDFKPNVLARQLSFQESNSIAVIVPNIQNPHFAEILSGITEIANKSDFIVMCSNSDEDPVKEYKAVKMYLQYMVKYIIIAPCGKYSNHQKVKIKNLLSDVKEKTILIDRDLPEFECHKVLFDDDNATYQATKYLLDQGNKNIACINGPKDVQPTEFRANGFMRAMMDANYDLQYINQKIFHGKDFSSESGYEIASYVIKNHNLDAFLTCNNELSVGFLRAAREYNLNINDTNWVAVDRLKILEEIGCKINYTFRNAYSLGKTAVTTLINNSCNKENKLELYSSVLLDVPLVLGGKYYSKS